MFLIQGIVLVILGALAIAVPGTASVAVAAFVGWLLFFACVFRVISLFRACCTHPGLLGPLSRRRSSWRSSASSSRYSRSKGAMTLTMVLTAYFIVHGISSFALAFAIKGHTGRWVLLLFGRALSISRWRRW